MSSSSSPTPPAPPQISSSLSSHHSLCVGRCCRHRRCLASAVALTFRRVVKTFFFKCGNNFGKSLPLLKKCSSPSSLFPFFCSSMAFGASFPSGQFVFSFRSGGGVVGAVGGGRRRRRGEAVAENGRGGAAGRWKPNGLSFSPPPDVVNVE